KIGASMNRTMAKEDIFNIERRSKNHFSALKNGTFSPHAQDNVIINKFIEAKFQGNYRHLLYECNAPTKTVYKNLVVLKKLVQVLNKPLVDLKEQDIINVQQLLNN